MSATPHVSVVLDVTRLATRFERAVPDGMGRVELGYAEQFVEGMPEGSSMVLTILGPRLVPNVAARAIVRELKSFWRETTTSDEDNAFQYVRARLRGEEVLRPPTQRRHDWLRITGHALRIFRDGPLIGWPGLFPGKSPVASFPTGAVYLNVGFFPLLMPRYFNSLRRRPDVKPVFLLHDQLPIEHPEYFPPPVKKLHTRCLELMMELARGVIVTGDMTKQALINYCQSTGRRPPPIGVIPLEPDPIFSSGFERDDELAGIPYFVVCGTIEPRKNHLLLLNIWREMAQQLKERTPKLVIVGVRGWENENIIDMLDRCDAIQPHIVEVARLSTPGLKRLMQNSRGLLMPSFAEGFGLPVAEALAAGANVVASSAMGWGKLHCAEQLRVVPPLDGVGWMREIREALLNSKPSAVSASALNPSAKIRVAPTNYCALVNRFIEGL